MPKVELRRVTVRRFAFIVALLQGIIGLVSGGLVAVGYLPLPIPGGSEFFRFLAPGILPMRVAFLTFLLPEGVMNSYPVLWVALMPAESFLVGLFHGTIIAALYNFVASRVGGLVFQMRFSFLEDRPPQLLKASEKKGSKGA